MKTKYVIGLSAVALCVAVSSAGVGVAVAGASAAADQKTAATDIAKAQAAIAKRKGDVAVRWAEAAVALRPQDPNYRSVLGQAYLLAGRFGSAKTAFNDALTLSPGDGKVALNLALAQIAEGDWNGARSTLDSYSGSIPVSDRGLAMALAGDPGGAVNLMLPVARSAEATPKLRQNLALALALSGRWQDARMVAGMDLAPTEVDKRLGQWATFARPAARTDQVAALLGVTPSADPGQPVALALSASVNPIAAPAPVEAPAPAIVAPVAEAAPAGAPVAVEPAPVAAPTVAAIVFGPRAEVVQPLPAKAVAPGKVAPLLRAPKTAVKTSFVKPLAALPTPGAAKVSVGKGNFFVQLGAYDNAGVARDGWARASRNYSGFAGQAPTGMPVTVGGKNFYRLSVGGFDEAGARRLCAGYRARGGTCFVRTSLGDKAADFGKR